MSTPKDTAARLEEQYHNRRSQLGAQIAAYYNGAPPYDEKELKKAGDRWRGSSVGDGATVAADTCAKAVNTCEGIQPALHPDEFRIRQEVVIEGLREDLEASIHIGERRIERIAEARVYAHRLSEFQVQQHNTLGELCERATAGLHLCCGNRDYVKALPEIAGRLKEAENICADVVAVLDALLVTSGNGKKHISGNVYLGPNPSKTCGVEAPRHDGLASVLNVLRDRFIYQLRPNDTNPCDDFVTELTGGANLVRKVPVDQQPSGSDKPLSSKPIVLDSQIHPGYPAGVQPMVRHAAGANRVAPELVKRESGPNVLLWESEPGKWYWQHEGEHVAAGPFPTRDEAEVNSLPF